MRGHMHSCRRRLHFNELDFNVLLFSRHIVMTPTSKEFGRYCQEEGIVPATKTMSIPTNTGTFDQMQLRWCCSSRSVCSHEILTLRFLATQFLLGNSYLASSPCDYSIINHFLYSQIYGSHSHCTGASFHFPNCIQGVLQNNED